MAQSSLNISLPTLDGDPQIMEYFEQQFNNIIKINKLSEIEAITLLKSKMVGAALKFYIEAPYLHTISKSSELIQKLKLYFVQPSHTGVIQEFESLNLRQNESIGNLAHRINILTAKVYPNIKNKEALQEIKLSKLLNAVPNTIKVKLIEAKLQSFDDAIDFATNLYNEYSQHNMINMLVPNDVVQDNRNNEFVNAIYEDTQQGGKNVNKQVQYQKRGPNKQKFQRDNFQNYKFKNNSHRRERHYLRNQIICQICQKKGHTANICFRYTDLLQGQQKFEPRGGSRRKYNNSRQDFDEYNENNFANRQNFNKGEPSNSNNYAFPNCR
jgi:hypothetical protein